jgi:hypothetical protein
MRHVCTLIAAVLVAPLSWLLLAAGQDGSAQAFATARDIGAVDAGDFVRPVMSLAGVGLVLGFLGTLRFSPLGAILIGGGYAATYLGLLVDPGGVLGLFPPRVPVAGRSIDPTTPIRTGTALLLGAFMVLAALSISRRRRWSSGVDVARRSAVEQARAGSPDRERTGTSPPAAEAEPEPMTRYASRLRPRNGGPRSYAFVDNSIERWALNSKAPWPYLQRP